MILPGSWAKVPGKALDAAKLVDFKPETLALAKEGQPPKALFDALLSKEMIQEAVKFSAASLPRREAVWWALACVRAAAGPAAPLVQTQAMLAVEKWVVQPKEEHRRACEKASPLATSDTPAGLLALAVFFAEGSIAAAESKVEIPTALPTAPRLIYATVVMAAVEGDASKFPDQLKKFVGLANDVANGTNRWKEAPR